MTRKNRTPEENARREKIRELLQMANIGSMDDIQSLFTRRTFVSKKPMLPFNIPPNCSIAAQISAEAMATS